MNYVDQPKLPIIPDPLGVEKDLVVAMLDRIDKSNDSLREKLFYLRSEVGAIANVINLMISNRLIDRDSLCFLRDELRKLADACDK
jgi:hypothetical protein